MHLQHHEREHEVPGGPAQLEEVSEGIFAYVQPDGSWCINNPGFILGPDGVVLIDTCFTEGRTRALMKTIRDFTELSVQTVINTHHHGDHTWGNGFLPEATIIGHRLCRTEMIATGLAL